MVVLPSARWCWISIACLLVALLLTACGGKGGSLPSQSGESPVVGLNEAPSGLPDLPRPSEIPRAASAPPTNADLYRNSSSYDGLLPHNKISNKVTDLDFQPDWDPGGSTAPEQLAYAGYRFTNLAEYAGEECLRLNWNTEPADYHHLWIAVADFAADAWRWYAVPAANTVSVTGFDDCINGAGELYALVLLTGTATATLDWIIIGGRLNPVAWLTTDLNPDPSQNIAPLLVEFSGAGSHVVGGEIVAWDFDFDDDGTYEVLGNVTGLAQYEYASFGAKTCRMRIHDDIDQQDETTVDFWVVNPANVTPAAHFTATPNGGSAPLPVILDASTTTDDTGIRLYEWDLDDDGEFEISTGNEATLDHIFAVNGANNVTLRVTDLDFATDTHTIGVPVAGGFAYAAVASGVQINAPLSAKAGGSGVNQRAGVAWQDWANLDLKFSIATNLEGSTYAAPVNAAPAVDDTGYSPSLHNDGAGFPMIAYGKRGGDNEFDLEFVRALTANGSSWDGPYKVNGEEHTGGDNALVKVFGKPSIVSVANTGIQSATSLYFYQSADTSGTSWPAGTMLVDGPDGGMLSAVSIVSAIVGFFEWPVVSYRSDAWGTTPVREVGVLHGTDITGTTWTDPEIVSDRDVRTTSLAVIAGHPALAAGSDAQGGSLFYGRAGDNAGDTWPDGMAELASGGHGGYCDLALVNGVPAICYFSFEGANLWYVDAADATGTSWNDPFIVASAGAVGEYCSMAVIGGNTPVIFYYDDGNDAVMAAYWIP